MKGTLTPVFKLADKTLTFSLSSVKIKVLSTQKTKVVSQYLMSMKKPRKDHYYRPFLDNLWKHQKPKKNKYVCKLC